MVVSFQVEREQELWSALEADAGLVRLRRSVTHSILSHTYDLVRHTRIASH
jgi:peptidoglycan/xylan/chitin deacetylase (PgdA/CDA1 family)